MDGMNDMLLDGKPLNMTPCYSIGFADGNNIKARGFSWLPNGWLAAHFDDGAIIFYPEHFIKWVVMVPAEEFQDEEDEEGKAPFSDPSLAEMSEGELICPSCGDGVVMREVAQAHTRAVCPQCGYRDPR